MIELKNVDIHCDDGTDIRQASAVVANGRSLLVYGRDAATRHCLAEALLGLRPTRIVRAGEIINQVPEIRAAHDEWVCAIPLHHPMSGEPALDALLRALG